MSRGQEAYMKIRANRAKLDRLRKSLQRSMAAVRIQRTFRATRKKVVPVRQASPNKRASPKKASLLSRSLKGLGVGMLALSARTLAGAAGSRRAGATSLALIPGSSTARNVGTVYAPHTRYMGAPNASNIHHWTPANKAARKTAISTREKHNALNRWLKMFGGGVVR